MKKIRVLHSLWVALFGGYAGIPQDTRLVFSALAQCDNIDVEAFFFSKRKSHTVFQSTVEWNEVERIARGDTFLQDALEDMKIKKTHLNIINKIKLIGSLVLSNTLLKKDHKLFPFDQSHHDALWDTVFSKSLDLSEKERVMNRQFYHSDLSWRDIMYANYFHQKTRLDTRDYDFVLFPDVRPVTVSSGTKKIIRYHDSFPVLCPDFFQTLHSKMHLASLKSCVKDSYFVCNSDPTRDDLIAIFPEVEEKAHVIAPAVAIYQPKKNWSMVEEICLSRVSHQLSPQPNLMRQFDQRGQSNEFEYILALSTLEPRKNYINLIRAWENLSYHHHKKIKLIIVANPGWLASDIEELMKPHLEMGEMIHLSNVSSEELPFLFSHATVFASLSFIEGFGIPPIEAMQCGAPVLASDNATHRWSLGDAAMYAEPYDIAAITEAMARLLVYPGADELRNTLREKAFQRVKLYHPTVVKEQWGQLFELLS